MREGLGEGNSTEETVKKECVDGRRRKGKEVKRENVERKQDGGGGVPVVRGPEARLLEAKCGSGGFLTARRDPPSLTPSLTHSPDGETLSLRRPLAALSLHLDQEVFCIYISNYRARKSR